MMLVYRCYFRSFLNTVIMHAGMFGGLSGDVHLMFGYLAMIQWRRVSEM